jgi:hypothetical protein
MNPLRIIYHQSSACWLSLRVSSASKSVPSPPPTLLEAEDAIEKAQKPSGRDYRQALFGCLLGRASPGERPQSQKPFETNHNYRVGRKRRRGEWAAGGGPRTLCVCGGGGLAEKEGNFFAPKTPLPLLSSYQRASRGRAPASRQRTTSQNPASHRGG